MRGRVLVLIGIAIVWAWLPAAPAAAGGCGEVTEGSTVTVALEGLCFHPSIVHVRPGRTVTFVNDDTMDHSVIGAGFSFAVDGVLEPGQGFSHTFDRPGVYPFSCYFHPGMTGAVVVGAATGSASATGSATTTGSASGSSAASDLTLAAGDGVRPTATSSDGSPRWWLAGLVGFSLGAGATALLRGRTLRSLRGRTPRSER